MAALQIALAPGVPRSRQRVTLDGREYVLALRWSQREERWYMDLLDGDDVLLVGSVKLVVGFPLLYRFRAIAGLPPGDLIVVDGRADAVDPGLADLGDVAQLIYMDAAEIAGASASATLGAAALPIAPGD